MSCRHKEPADIHFSHVPQKFNPYDSAVCYNGACAAFFEMTRRRMSSMPTGMVIAALAVIALVAFIALFLFGGLSQDEPAPVPPAVQTWQ